MATMPINIFPQRGEPITLNLRLDRDDPIREANMGPRAVQPELPIPPGEEPTRDKVKKIVSYFIVGLGLLLLTGAFGMLAGHTFGLLTIDPTAIQTVFICGLSGALGGFSLQNSDYRGSLNVSHPSLPFSYSLQQR